MRMTLVQWQYFPHSDLRSWFKVRTRKQPPCIQGKAAYILSSLVSHCSGSPMHRATVFCELITAKALILCVLNFISILLSPGSKKSESSADQRDNIVLTPKNVQALRTLFNVAHRLHNVLGPSWILVLETLAALDRAIHSPHASTQEVSTSVSKLSRETSGHYSDFNILSSLNSQLFESSALMHVSAVKSLLSALRQLSSQCIYANLSSTGQALTQQIENVEFSVERMMTILVNNLQRVEPIWDQIIGHLLELAVVSHPLLRNLALDSLDQSICAVLAYDRFQGINMSGHQFSDSQLKTTTVALGSFECAVLSPLMALYSSSQSFDVRAGSLKTLLHVLERHGEKLQYSWPNILAMLRTVAEASEKDLIALGFQSIRVIMNDGISTIPAGCLDVCIEVTGEFSAQKTDINISLTAIGLLWTATDFIAKGLADDLVHPTSRTEEIDQRDKDQTSLDDQIVSSSDEVRGKVHLPNMVDSNKLLLSVFSILRKLGADERPEVRNSAIRTLFQILGTHGQKISRSMWEDCLWNYVFPILDRVSHLAATSSRDEWHGKELGIRGGKAIHMLIHHSRNTAQKQWDETLVLVLGGVTRLLRSYLPFLQSLSKFSSCWDLLLNFIKDSILNGSKEVALAAVNCLQTTASSQCSKGSLAVPYVKSMLDIYELVLQSSPKYRSDAASKVKQDILHGLGDLYVKAQSIFDTNMYTQVLALLQLAIRNSKSSGDTEREIGNVAPVLRVVLEILPLLRPSEHLSSMWPQLLRELLHYLLESEVQSDPSKDELAGKVNDSPDSVNGCHTLTASESDISEDSTSSSFSIMFKERLVPVIVELFLEAPLTERCNILPEVIQGLGRCMSTRRDNPKGLLWRLAVEGFNRILIDDTSKRNEDSEMDLNLFKLARARFWKEVADVYEIFLVGSCGRALSSHAPTAEELKADEIIEMNVVWVLGDSILKKQIDAPIEILQRLVTALDRCASRTGCLPLESVELMPSHCSRFSLSCLQMLFSLCSFTGDSWNSTRLEVGKISTVILMRRCEFILNQFLTDENNRGEHPLPIVRIEEAIDVLKELARLVIHEDNMSVLNLPPNLRDALTENKDACGQAHLLILFPTFCDLVASRESRIRELVQVLLRLIAGVLELRRIDPTT